MARRLLPPVVTRRSAARAAGRVAADAARTETQGSAGRGAVVRWLRDRQRLGWCARPVLGPLAPSPLLRGVGCCVACRCGPAAIAPTTSGLAHRAHGERSFATCSRERDADHEPDIEPRPRTHRPNNRYRCHCSDPKMVTPAAGGPADHSVRIAGC